MFTDDDIAQFRTFGFVVVRGLLTRAEATALATEITAAQRDAFGPAYVQRRGGGGIEGHYLPLMAHHTPLSAGLVVDDGRLVGIAEALLGGPVVPLHAEGVLHFGEAGWHQDDGIGVTGLKAALYLQSLAAATGTLRLLPLSQHPGLRTTLEAHRTRCSGTFPSWAAETRPGDAVVFDLHAWHASVGGCDRLAWNVEYLAVPGDEAARQRLLVYAADHQDQTARRFDRDRYPVWRDWTTHPHASSRRRAAIARLRRLGVLDLPGAALGDAASPPARP